MGFLQYIEHGKQAGGREWLYCFLVLIRDRLIATSVTSHSNERALRVAYSDYAIEEGQQRLRKTKKEKQA